jgi:hypothetical protein
MASSTSKGNVCLPTYYQNYSVEVELWCEEKRKILEELK